MTPHQIDHHVAKRIRSFRKASGISARDLAHAIGVSWQQLMKYETAANRISAGRLYMLARKFGIPISTFFPEN